MHNSDPPTCSIHAGLTHPPGAPKGNTNRQTHGFYSSTLQQSELADLITYAGDMTLDDEIAIARVALRRVLNAISSAEKDNLSSDAYSRLAALAFQGTRTVARLLRDRRALSGESSEGIAGAIAQALDELGSEWGLDL